MSPNRKRSRSYGEFAVNPDRQPDAHATFRAHLRAGDYNAIVGRKLRRALREAAAIPDLEFEIGAVRIALYRLLREEPDPARLAAGAARLCAVAAQAARLRQDAPTARDDMHARLARVLAEIDAENEVESEPSPATPCQEET